MRNQRDIQQAQMFAMRTAQPKIAEAKMQPMGRSYSRVEHTIRVGEPSKEEKVDAMLTAGQKEAYTAKVGAGATHEQALKESLEVFRG